MNVPSLSIHLLNFSAEDPGGWQHLLDRARSADIAGIDRLVVSDHIAFGDNLDAYGDPARGGSAGSTQPTGPDGHWLEPLTVLSVVAGMTTTARLQTAILLAALRRPAVLAKQLATLDVLSGGRLDVGVGIGWQRAEYEACGLDYGRRGSLLNDTLTILAALWTEPVAAVETPSAAFASIHAMPKPFRPGGVPVWVSGTLNDAVVDRIVRFGSGWIPWGEDAKDPATGVARLRRAFDEAGRDMSGFEVPGVLPLVRTTHGGIDLDATMDSVPPLVESGLTDFRLNVSIPVDVEEAIDVLSPIVAAFRSVTR